MNVNKQASKDAFDFARALMAFGEGAGTQRKLIKARIDHRIDNIPGYAKAYQAAFQAQDMAKHAEQAKHIHRVKKAKKVVDRNAKGILTGNKQQLTTGVAIAVTVAFYAHETGIDKVAWAYSKRKYTRAKNYIHAKRIGLHIPDTTKDI